MGRTLLLPAWIVLIFHVYSTICKSSSIVHVNGEEYNSTEGVSLPLPAPVPFPAKNNVDDILELYDDSQQHNNLKETTKIVTIKLYPPSFRLSNESLSNSSSPMTVTIPKPFEGLEEEYTNDKMANMELKRSEGSLNHKDLATADHSSGELNNIDYSLLCRDGQPYLADGKPLYCAVSSGCPAGYWCHTGSSKATTFCCPHSQTDNGCSLPVVSGYGSGQMERWQFDQSDGVCKLFVYTGYGGNQNNFLTAQDCADACGLLGSKEKSAESFYVHAATRGNPQPTYETVHTERPTGNMQIFTQPAVGNAQVFTEPVLSITAQYTTMQTFTQPPQVQNTEDPANHISTMSYKKNTISPAARCLEKGGVMGSGMAFTTRWAYDTNDGLCKSFMYAGIGGTNNNFYSEFECSYICKGVSVNQQGSWTTPEPMNKCNLPYNKGTGYNPTLRWFYNSQIDECQQFTFMGTGGNGNNFVDEESCRTTCRSVETIDEDEPCYMKPNIGNGSGNETRYYYDYNTKECEVFPYTGHGGNKNNFISMDICKQTCVYEFGQSLEFPRQHPKPMDSKNQYQNVPLAVKNLNIMENKNIEPVMPGMVPGFNVNTGTIEQMPQSFMSQMETSKNLSPNEPVSVNNLNPQIPFNSLSHSQIGLTTSHSGFEANKFPIQPVFVPNGPATTAGLVPMIQPFGTNLVNNNSNVFVPTNINQGSWQPVNQQNWQPGSNGNQIMPVPNTYPLDFMPISSHSFVPPGPQFGTVSLSNQQPQSVVVSPVVVSPLPPNNFIATNNVAPVNVPFSQNLPNSQNTFNFVPDLKTDAGIAVPVSEIPSPKPHPPNQPVAIDTLNNLVILANQSVQLKNVFSPTENRNLSKFVNITSVAAAQICNGFIPLGDVSVCGPENDFQCPPRFVCHIAVPFSLCCPQQASISTCSMEPDVGTGDNKVTRWHFNSKTGHCESFIFRGLNGNPNNFLTYDQCVNGCGSNPCSVGKALRVNDENVLCGRSPRESCPMNYYCHIGSNALHTVCCPRQGNPCLLPMNPGTGSDSLQRWFFDSASRKCQNFIYTGLGGNENNFLNDQECLSTCHVRRQSSSPCGTGQPAQSGRGELMHCSTHNVNTCPPKYFCHIGAGPETTLCCPLSGTTSACNLPLSTGRGNAVLPRWYYDVSSSTCKAFTYTGLGGNENNFLSINDCRTICPEFDNPCPAGKPFSGSDVGQVQFCSAVNPSCPNNYWCHLGADKQTTVCCPFSVHPCNLPRVEGLGSAQLPRYYFDKYSKQCRPFMYTGKGGNQNNFLGKSDCEAACPIVDNPCAEGMPALDSSGQPQFCSTANPDVCPESHWCHVGSNAASTLCCPGSSDPCRLPVTRGSGTAVLNRWYFNTDTKTCLSFTYSGRNGNQNNFLSLGECRINCQEFQNPCSTGQAHISLSGQITHCGATEPTMCPTTYWCHIGATLESSVCCPGAGNPCEAHLEEGNGNANLVRYYYDNNAQVCKQFQYSGMGGNENNFQTIAECEQRCPVFRNPCSSGDPARDRHGHVIPCSVSDINACPKNFWCHVGGDEQSTLCCPGAEFPCTETLQVGNGVSALPRHFYNSLTQQCLPFTYSGIGGNQNNYLSRADCEKACPVFVNPCSQGAPATGPNGQYVVCTASTPNVCPANYWCHVGDLSTNSVCCPGDEIPCVLPLSTGNGNAALSRWHFDTNVRRCTRFTYSGMGGNPNNFLTLQDCQLRCPEYENPCLIGDPAQSESGGALFCSTSASTCPDDHWCHIGADPDSTVCCLGDTDPCTQPMLPGSGSAKLNRWYFNQNTKQCLQFTYTGKRGNQNNFLSETDCIQKCPVFRNPCGTNMSPNHIVYCSTQSRDVCPAGYWCHVGPSADTSVCCPGASDPCTLPSSQGVFMGSQPLVRWHFDIKEKRCKQFQYAGSGGNQNNFLTQQECQHKCPEFVNPCLKGEPYREKQTALVRYCSRNSPTDCPQQFWCHLGANTLSTVCCPGGGDPCTLPLAVGNGPASLPRWYFNIINRQCQQFTYSGLSGNQNNFQTQRECQASCPEFSNPCSEGTPLTAINGQITYCTAQNPNVCPVKFYCHVGPSSDTSVCCPTVGDSCHLPKLVGRGNVALQRWNFNSLTRRCESFTYSGAGGNANNYMTLEACRIRCQEFNNPCEGEPYRSASGQILFCNADSVCPPKHFCHYGIDTTTTMCCPAHGADDFCLLPVVIGSGSAKLTRWYHNFVTKTCISFIYSGMGGNENNFRSQAECQSQCSPIANPCTPGTNPYMESSGKPQQCSSVSTGFDSAMCPNGFYCHNGADQSTTVCCPLLGNPCDMPQTVGTGTAVLQRWYFDKFAGHCEMFTYTGIGGNGNNFLTEQECHRKCGSGHLLRQSARNNPSSSKCPHGEPIVSVLGLPGVCVNQPQGPSCPPDYTCLITNSNDGICCPDAKKFCMYPFQTGSTSCNTRIGSENNIRFGYNPDTDSCYPFRYTGCGGNLNNFPSLKQCNDICSSKKLFAAVHKETDIVTLHDFNGAMNGTDDLFIDSNNATSHSKNFFNVDQNRQFLGGSRSLGWLQSMVSWFKKIAQNKR